MMKSFGRLLLAGPAVEVARLIRRSIVPVLSYVAVVMLVSAAPAFATGSGLAAVDSAATAGVKVIQALAGFAFLVGIGLGIWEYFSHRSFLKMGFEFGGALIAGVIAFNASQVATLVGVSGALVR